MNELRSIPPSIGVLLWNSKPKTPLYINYV